MASRNRTSLLSLALVALVAVLAGCGGQSSTDKFKKDFRPLDTQLKSVGDTLGKTLTTASGKTDAQLATELNDETTRLGTIDAKLKDLKPPDKAKTDFDELKAQLAQVHTDLAQLTTAARTHNVGAARSGAARLVSDSQQIKPIANKVRGAVGLPLSK